MIDLRSIHHAYQDVPVLRDVSLHIDEGEYVAIMGPSGSGKSTLLNILAGLEQPSEGSVTWWGEDMTRLSAEECARIRLQRWGFVFQDAHLMESLSLLDNIVLPALILKAEERGAMMERARELMALTGISEAAWRLPSEVSGGQRQRAGLCRALINQPDILVGDEPTGALNTSSTQEILDLIDQVRRGGSTVVVVTHDPGVAARAERVMLMVDGRLQEECSLEGSLTQRREQVGRLLLAHGV